MKKTGTCQFWLKMFVKFRLNWVNIIVFSYFFVYILHILHFLKLCLMRHLQHTHIHIHIHVQTCTRFCYPTLFLKYRKNHTLLQGCEWNIHWFCVPEVFMDTAVSVSTISLNSFVYYHRSVTAYKDTKLLFGFQEQRECFIVSLV